ncbi:MAG: alpha/beta hydrolase [Burkholderiales bacterium]|nr:alpha/beta hydrolase [Burkholderiales bacterium]
MFVHRPDARLLTLSFGHGPNTLLALGGWAGSGELWHPVFGHLPHWRCVSYDHRGSGASVCAADSITIDAMVDDLFAVADAQGIERCVLAAESSGAMVALEAALRRPGRFSALVLAGAAWQPPAPGAQDAFIGALRADHEAALRGFAQACLPEAGSQDLQRWGLHILRRSPLAHAIALLQCREATTVHQQLGRIHTPTLLLHGSDDRISPPATAQALARALPRAELHLMPGLGHVPMLSAPAEVARLIDKGCQCLDLLNTPATAGSPRGA